MNDARFYGIMEKTAKENPDKVIAVLDNGEAVLADSRERLFKKVRGLNVKCIGHGINKNEEIVPI